MRFLHAIEAGDIARVRELIASGADLNEADDDGCFTALGLAAYHGRIEILRELLDAGVPPDSAAGACALAGAALGGQLESARILIEAGASLNHRDETGMTPLMNAARVGQLPAVRYLVEQGADLECRDDSGGRYAQWKSALDYAIDEGYPDIAELLLARGARFDPEYYEDESGAMPSSAGDLIELARRCRTEKESRENADAEIRRPGSDSECPGIVSLWVGAFPSVEAAEAYFGIPDEIGVYLPPEAFARDLGVDQRLIGELEVNFERLDPRPLFELLEDVTFVQSFRDQALRVANKLGIDTAQGIALVYDFDYQAKAGWQRTAGPMTFIGTFPFRPASAVVQLNPRRDPRIEIREASDGVL